MSRRVHRDRQRWDMEPGAPWKALVRLAVGLSLAAAVLIMAGCGGGDGGGDESADGEAKRGGQLRLAITDAQTTEKLDPATTLTSNDRIYAGAIYESLTTVDQDWNVSPALATAWEPNEDATEWTITLREGVKWHDGSPFTSTDVAFSLKRVLDEELGSSLYSRLNPVLEPSGITAPDDLTVALKLKRADSLIPVALANAHAKVVKDGTEEFTVETAIGTGPFKLKSWTPGRSWALERNPEYWQKGLPYLDQVTAVVVPEQSTKLQSVVSGQNDLTDAIDLTSLPSVEGNPNVEVARIDNRASWVFAFDSTQEPFDDPLVVEALKVAQDRDQMLQSVWQGNGTLIADVPFTEESQFYPGDLSTEPDVERAKQLLAEAGHEDGLEIELTTSAVAPGMVEMATAFQQVMKPAGIDVKLNQMPTSAYWNKGWMQTPAFQDYWNPRHPAEMLSLFYASDAVWNEGSYKSKEMDDLIARVFATTDEEEQRTLVQEAYTYAHDNFPYAIPVSTPQMYVHKKNLSGVALDYVDYIDLTKIATN